MNALNRLLVFGSMLALAIPMSAQNTKPKSYIISKNDFYTMDIKSNKPEINLFSEEKKWVGDKDDNNIKGNRINYASSFEDITDVEAFSISPEKKKEKVRDILTGDVEIENIFYHDMKYKYYLFNELKSGSETYSSFRKAFKKPQFLDAFYFKDDLDCKTSAISLKVSNKIEIGYVLQGEDTDKILFTTTKDPDYTTYHWELKDSNREEFVEEAPGISYYSPHLIFYIKDYTNDLGKQNVLGSVENLYNFYYETIKGINKTDETELKARTTEITNGLTSDYDKAKSIFDYVQTNVNYVAFEDGMGGFIPREAADIFRKKYGDCKDMANLLNEMLNFSGIESHIGWIGTRHNNYSYEKVPTPIVDNHMIAVAKINGEYYFLDATGKYTIFPNITPFIQGKQALLKIDEKNYKVVEVPFVAAEKNNTSGKITFSLEGNVLKGKADFALSGFLKSRFIGQYKSMIDNSMMGKNYLSRFIENITTSNIVITNDDLSDKPLRMQNDFALDKWIKPLDGQLLFKPILFFPYSDSRIDDTNRKVPYEFDYKESYHFDYEFTIPDGYGLEFKPEDFNFSNNFFNGSIKYVLNGKKLQITQTIAMNMLLLEKKDFSGWNNAIKEITKHYNQNIILSKI